MKLQQEDGELSLAYRPGETRLAMSRPHNLSQITLYLLRELMIIFHPKVKLFTWLNEGLFLGWEQRLPAVSPVDRDDSLCAN